MNAKDAVRTTMNTADFMVESYLSDITPQEMLVRPAPGANHLAWQLGHLISAETRLVEAAAPGSMPALPEGFAERHSKETACQRQPGRLPLEGRVLETGEVSSSGDAEIARQHQRRRSRQASDRPCSAVRQARRRLLRHGRWTLDLARRPVGRVAPPSRARSQVLGFAAFGRRCSPAFFARPYALPPMRRFGSVSHNGLILLGSPMTSASVVLRKACSTCANAASSRRCSGQSFVPCVANSSGHVRMRRIGSVALTISRIVNFSGE